MLSRTQLAAMMSLLLLCLPAGCSQGKRNAPPVTEMERHAEEVETVEEHWPNGQLRLRKQVVHEPDGTLADHGTYTSWYDNGQKEYEAVFVHGKKHGVVTRWHKNGGTWMEEHYENGKKHGATFVWDEAGRKRKEENYFDGRPHGTWTVWDASGRIKWQGRFDHGNPQP